jgi:hypothetical protein
VLFPDWTALLVAELRRMIPDVRASRRGKIVRISYGAHEARVEADGERARIWLGERVAFTPAMDEATARVIARSLAGTFDVERWGRG